MNKSEAIQVLTVLKTAYPNFYKTLSKSDAENTIELWATMFESEPVNLVIEAVKTLICSLKYPPTIADVKEKIREITKPGTMTELEAWSKVKGSISYYNAGNAFNGLPPLLQKLVGSPQQLREWAIMDIDTLNTVVQSNFLRSYSAKVKQEAMRELIPESTKVLIEQLSDKFKMIGG